ncbi:hypothetical protein PV327_005141 [Microctonus hyperodae]|uniref:Uncharacterized protein n=1 Tax=Microctonus hyperodae TaxID=165561 RepID=A0AA39G135_MICHY|nr:hypothetical protein PV327_005141 [Microctonus hyperodae]
MMATQKILLHDYERDIDIEAYLFSIDAQRAATDINFATDSLQNITDQDVPLSTSTNKVDSSNDDTKENFSCNEVFNTKDPADINFEAQESESSSYSGMMAQRKVCENISQELQKTGDDVTYEATKYHNIKLDNEKRNQQQFEIMEEISDKKAWRYPTTLASSTGLLIQQSKTSDSVRRSNSGCSSKSKKRTIITILEKSLNRAEEHEENKKKRHKVQMKICEKFLKRLKKFSD